MKNKQSSKSVKDANVIAWCELDLSDVQWEKFYMIEQMKTSKFKEEKVRD